MHWAEALEVFVPWLLITAFALYVVIRIASRAGFSTGTTLLLGFSIPIGLIYIAFAKWPADERLRKYEDLIRRRAGSKVLKEVDGTAAVRP